ncbi:Myosin-J heavy chain [Hordeum vulgare]|nr:Myosin-J heavy chain [Hordeum vulgare]
MGNQSVTFSLSRQPSKATRKTDDPTDPTLQAPKKVRRNLRGNKWEEERAKREGAAVKLAERFEDILAKKEEACVRRSKIREDKKAGRFKLLMYATDKKFKLEERRTMIEERKVALEEKRVKVVANAEDATMLTLNIDPLDAEATYIVQFVRYQMLQRRTMKT